MATQVIEADTAFVKRVLRRAGINAQVGTRRRCACSPLWLHPDKLSRGHCDTKAEKLARAAGTAVRTLGVQATSTATWLSLLPRQTRKILQPCLPIAVVYCPAHGATYLCGDVWGEYNPVRRRWELHRDDGPAVVIGKQLLYSWQGRLVKRETVMNEATATAAMAEENVTDREILIRRIGTEKFVNDANLTVRNESPEHGAVLMTRVDPATLVGPWSAERQKAELEQLSYLKVTCPSTGHVYFLRVAPNVQTAKEALEWTAGGDVDYAELAQET